MYNKNFKKHSFEDVKAWQLAREFRKEILSFVSDDDDPEEVVHLNIQFYPLTNSWEEPNKGGSK